ncbi:microsomal signal peptidase 12kDa subunit [Myriangium duriaei CBS 260.36]|uniref:Signal peptidase complex subunit 1 n=1 Tax=Myriangium duriaei CBS 260.36 TaxID=1168546 RepID=A0A9P4J5W8_9PEZI|nr:microsomal signal peptidase 12kDa subunit [Myriangium duriaei CBS 260.36]
MAAILDKAREVYEGEIDFEGQRLAEGLSTYLLSIVGVLCFLVGYVTNNITYTLWVGLGGTALTFVVIVPPWPFFNKHPVQWLPARKSRGPAGPGYNIVVDGKKVQ